MSFRPSILLVLALSCPAWAGELDIKCHELLTAAESLPTGNIDFETRHHYENWLEDAGEIHAQLWMENDASAQTVFARSPLIKMLTEGPPERLDMAQKLFIRSIHPLFMLDARDFNPLVRLHLEKKQFDLALHLAMKEGRGETPIDKDNADRLLAFLRAKMAKWQYPNAGLVFITHMDGVDAAVHYFRDHMDQIRARFTDEELAFVALHGDESDIIRLERLAKHSAEHYTEAGSRCAIDIIRQRLAGIPIYCGEPGRYARALDSALYPHLPARK